MTGLDKMVSQILEEANNSASEKIEQAKAKAEEIKADAEREAAAMEQEILQKSATAVAHHKERIKSSSDLKHRTAMLAAKQQMIAEVIEKAYAKFCAKEDKEYFETLIDMLKKFAQPEEGQMLLSKEDLEKLPKGFEEEVAAIAKAKGGSLTIAKECSNIEKGFILSYGGIEENCSFRALFEAKQDELQDQVQRILFL